MPPFTPDSRLADAVRPSPNHGARRGGKRPDLLLLHYTGMKNSEAALRRLCEPAAEVSCHYLVFEDGRIVQLVPETRRAWHAGLSCWQGERDINSCSIGIEIANPGHDHGYPKFPRRQMQAVIALCEDIVKRHRIRADRVLGHSDVAPERKNDPGEKFPWASLASAGVGLWPRPSRKSRGESLRRGDRGAAIRALQQALTDYGYGLTPSGSFDHATEAVVAAFQRHFRPARIDGIADPSTQATLHRLLAARQPLPPTTKR